MQDFLSNIPRTLAQAVPQLLGPASLIGATSTDLAIAASLLECL